MKTFLMRFGIAYQDYTWEIKEFFIESYGIQDAIVKAYVFLNKYQNLNRDIVYYWHLGAEMIESERVQ